MKITYFIERANTPQELLLHGVVGEDEEVFSIFERLIPKVRRWDLNDFSEQTTEMVKEAGEDIWHSFHIILDNTQDILGPRTVSSYVRLKEWYEYKEQGRMSTICNKVQGKDVEIVSNEEMDSLFMNPRTRDDTKAYYSKVSWEEQKETVQSIVVKHLLPAIDPSGKILSEEDHIRIGFYTTGLKKEEDLLSIPRYVLQDLIVYPYTRDTGCLSCFWCGEEEMDQHTPECPYNKAKKILEIG